MRQIRRSLRVLRGRSLRWSLGGGSLLSEVLLYHRVLLVLHDELFTEYVCSPLFGVWRHLGMNVGTHPECGLRHFRQGLPPPLTKWRTLLENLHGAETVSRTKRLRTPLRIVDMPNPRFGARWMVQGNGGQNASSIYLSIHLSICL